MEEKSDDFGGFVERFVLRPPPPSSDDAPPRPLEGLTFAVKDIFDIAGYVTGFGNPDWARTHPVATSTAPVVLAVIEAGATCVGKTIMDEMAYSINGENIHYGTPVNPVARDRVPGGSSSGSAVVVAAGLVDFALGCLQIMLSDHTDQLTTSRIEERIYGLLAMQNVLIPVEV